MWDFVLHLRDFVLGDFVVEDFVQGDFVQGDFVWRPLVTRKRQNRSAGLVTAMGGRSH